MILDDIVGARREDVARAKRQVPLSELEQRPAFAEARRGFAAHLRRADPAVIAEVKKASPSRGVIRADFDPVAIARSYATGGAAAVSVLTEERYFQGSLRYLADIREAMPLPVLRKDFLFDPYQIVEARAWGADAVLLIAAVARGRRPVERASRGGGGAAARRLDRDPRRGGARSRRRGRCASHRRQQPGSANLRDDLEHGRALAPAAARGSARGGRERNRNGGGHRAACAPAGTAPFSSASRSCARRTPGRGCASCSRGGREGIR